MFRSYLRSFWRSVSRSKGLFMANLLGLSMAVAFAVFVGSYLDYEWSYDSSYKHKDQLYRLVNENYVDGVKRESSLLVTPGLPVLLQESVPGVRAYARYELGTSFLKGTESFVEATYCHAEPDLYEMFSLNTLAGNAATLYKNPNAVFVSESFAVKTFGTENPLGQTLISNDEETYLISGVFADFPENSHLDFDVFISKKFNPKLNAFPNNYGGVPAYIWLDASAKRNEVETALQQLLTAHNRWYDGTEVYTGSNVWLQPLSEIHLHSAGWSGTDQRPGNMDTLYALLVSVIIVICVSWFNYLNLTLASAFRNRKGIAVRKIIGARQAQLVHQFLFDAFMILLLALPVAISVVQALGPLFNQYIGRTAGGGSFLTFFANNFGGFSATLLVLLLICSLACGYVIAITSLSGRPTDLLKNLISRKTAFTKTSLQNGFILIQVVAAISVSIIVYGIFNQLKFMEQEDLGFDAQATVVLSELHVPYRDLPTNSSVFKTAVAQLPFVKEVTASQSLPGGLKNHPIHRLYKKDEAGVLQMTDFGIVEVDNDFTSYYDLELVGGSYFRTGGNDSTILINESAMRAMGYETPRQALNQKFSIREEGRLVKKTIFGVLKDYHHQSFKETFKPLIFRPTVLYDEPLFSVRISDIDRVAAVTALEEVWNELYPDRVFQFEFLEDHLHNQYSSERTFGRVTAIMSAGLVLISMLGLLGIVYLTTIRLSREISIRRVLGASSLRIGKLLALPFIRTLFLAMLLAIPIAYYVIDYWLKDFAFRISIGPQLLATPVLILIGLMALALTIQFTRTLNIRVLDHLKDE